MKIVGGNDTFAGVSGVVSEGSWPIVCGGDCMNLTIYNFTKESNE